MTTLLDRLRRLLGRQDAAAPTAVSSPTATSLTLDNQSLAALLRQIQLTHAGQYTCAETADLLDEYVELVAGRADAERLLPLVKGHLDHCVDCTARYETLLRIIESEG